jgi:hypothetical protein
LFNIERSYRVSSGEARYVDLSQGKQ